MSRGKVAFYLKGFIFNSCNRNIIWIVTKETHLFNSLYSKIAAGLAALFLGVGLIFIAITVFSTDMYQQEVNQKLNTGLAGQIVKERLLMEKGRVNQDALKEIFHMLMVINPGIEIYLLDPGGKILTFSAPEGSVKRESVSLEPVRKWINARPDAPVMGDDPKNPDRKKVFSAAPIIREGVLEGYLYVILGGEQYDSVAQKIKSSYILQLSAWMIGGGILFALAAGLILFGVLTGRLKRLAGVMETFRQGDGIQADALPEVKHSRGMDEIDRLSITFKEMAGRIEKQMAQLKASDEMRREMVANVSHDLRTPLATLQGYIETLLIKESKYTPQERKEYLEMAIRHCRRLNDLVSDLLELARLEAAEMKIYPEAFILPELCADIAQKFMLAAKEKQIDIKMDFHPSAGFVRADIALMERAMENLIENALRYTPENGRVTIGIKRQGSDILLKVCDTGKGIPADELPHIFERFYRSVNDRGGSDGHWGLGLAITHRIIGLHKSELKVESSQGQGSCFYFSLPAEKSL